jgi:hypothetical protein
VTDRPSDSKNHPHFSSDAAWAWQLPSGSVSLPEVHGSIAVPEGIGFWRKLLAFAGPGYLVALGRPSR